MLTIYLILAGILAVLFFIVGREIWRDDDREKF